MNIEARIAALEAENRDLCNRLAALEGAQQPKKAPPRPVEEDRRPFVTTLSTAVHLRHLPDAAEAAALLRIVTARYPTLKFRNATGELESFRCACFRHVVDEDIRTNKYAASWFVDTAQQWCRENNVQGVVRGLLPAIVATGDVQYSLDDFSAHWLDPHRASGRVVDPSAWRQILSGGDLIVPTKLNVFIDHSIGLQRTQSAW
jgi:hypothetical protein